MYIFFDDDQFLAASANITPMMANRHTLRVPPCQKHSFESAEDTARSSVSGSPCPSPVSIFVAFFCSLQNVLSFFFNVQRCGSMLTLPSNSFAVAHDYYAKFPEEIDLRFFLERYFSVTRIFLRTMCRNF